MTESGENAVQLVENERLIIDLLEQVIGQQFHRDDEKSMQLTGYTTRGGRVCALHPSVPNRQSWETMRNLKRKTMITNAAYSLRSRSK